MQLVLRLRHHDHDFLERQVGMPLYSHLRNARALAESRAEVIERAWRVYRRAEAGSKSAAELGGSGLIVIQRAMLATEDLGRLLHAFSAGHPWLEFRRAKLDDLGTTFQSVAEKPGAPLERMGLLSPSVLRQAGLPKPALEAALKLHEITARVWSEQLYECAGLWLTHAPLARATTHGFPVIAGEHFTEPPGAGELNDHVSIPPKRPFAVAMISNVRGKEVNSQLHTVHLDREMVRLIRDLGRTAARLYGQLAELKANCLDAGQEGTLPLLFADRLGAPAQRALNREARRRSESVDG